MKHGRSAYIDLYRQNPLEEASNSGHLCRCGAVTGQVKDDVGGRLQCLFMLFKILNQITISLSKGQTELD